MNEIFTSIFTFRRSYQGVKYDLLFKKFNTCLPTIQNNIVFRRRFAVAYESTVKSYFYGFNSKLTFHTNDQNIISFSFYKGVDNHDNSTNLGMMRPRSSGAGFRSFNSKIIDVTDYGNTSMSPKWSNNLYFNNLITFLTYYSNRDYAIQTTVNKYTSTNTIKISIIENNDL